MKVRLGLGVEGGVDGFGLLGAEDWVGCGC